MKINKYFIFAFIYFFINSLALPFGLTYMAILSPLLYWWVISTRKKEILLPFFVCLSPFFIMHFILGVNTRAYILSVINYTAVYIFCQAFYTFLKLSVDPEKIFKQLLIINFILCLVAIPVYFTSYDWLLWMEHALTSGADDVKRLKLFTYEASYYASLFTPLFFFYLLQLVLNKNRMNSWLLLPMLFLPYILSFSIGVIGSVTIAIMLTYLLHFKKLTGKRRLLNLFMLVGVISVAAFAVLVFFFPQNSFFLRLDNILVGNDSSGNGRTSEAFILARQILEQKSLAWGIGPGQVKILGADIIRSYYLYDLDYTNFAIPNAAAETFAIFGWIGLSLRILAELFFFFLYKGLDKLLSFVIIPFYFLIPVHW